MRGLGGVGAASVLGGVGATSVLLGVVEASSLGLGVGVGVGVGVAVVGSWFRMRPRSAMYLKEICPRGNNKVIIYFLIS